MAAEEPTEVITWRDLIGEKDWEGLLNPLEPQLGQELTRYCKLIGVIIESLRSEHFSFGDLSDDYEVNKNFFASTKNIMPKKDDTGHSNWVGYAAVNTDEGKRKIGRREIVIAIRGTVNDEEWYPKYCMRELVPAHDIFPQESNANLQKGRYNYYVTADCGHEKTSFRGQVLEAVKELVAKYQSEENLSIVVTGFSMGGAFATLIATDLAYNGYNKIDGRAKAIPVTAFAFANAPVGDEGFLNVASRLDDLHILRVKYESDANPDSPTEKDKYYHVGKQLVITLGVHNLDTKDAHNLDVYKQAIKESQPALPPSAPHAQND